MRAGPEEGHKKDQRAGAPLQKEADIVESIQSGTEKAPGRPHCGLLMHKSRFIRMMERDFFLGLIVIGQRLMVLN